MQYSPCHGGTGQRRIRPSGQCPALGERRTGCQCADGHRCAVRQHRTGEAAVRVEGRIGGYCGAGGAVRGENARTALDQDEYSERYNGLVSRYEAVKAQFDEISQTIADKADRKKLLEQFLHTVETQKPIAEFDERLWSSLVDFVMLYSE